MHPGEKIALLGSLRKLGFPRVAGIGRQPVLREPARVAEADGGRTAGYGCFATSGILKESRCPSARVIWFAERDR